MEINQDVTLPLTFRLMSHDFKPVATDTANEVTLVAAGPATACETTGPTTVFLSGQDGDVCDVQFHVDGTSDFPPTDIVVSLEFTATDHVSWTIVSGPPASACFSPGDAVPDLIVTAAAGTESIVGVKILTSYFVNPDGDRVESSYPHLTYSWFHPDSTRLTVEFDNISPAVPVPSMVGFTLGFSEPGTGVWTRDAPDEFDWAIKSSCP